MTDNFQKYFELKTEIKALETQLDELKKPIMDAILDNDLEKTGLEKPFGTFKLKNDRKYQYSEELLAKEENIKMKIKTMKRDEEMNGTAKCLKDGYTLVFSFNKSK